MSNFIGQEGQHELPKVKPIENTQSPEVTEDIFKNSLKELDALAVLFERQGTKLASQKKRSLLRILKAILFETEETEKVFGKDEKIMLDLCRGIMYHRQIVEIFLMKEEAFNLRKDLSNEQ